MTLNKIVHQTIGTKVTKRAVETKLPIGTFGFSEYSQIFESTSSSSVPKVRENYLFLICLFVCFFVCWFVYLPFFYRLLVTSSLHA